MNTSEKLLGLVNKSLSQTTPLTEADLDRTFKDLGIDSLDRMLVAVAVQEGFEISIPEEILPQMQNLGELRDYIEKNAAP